MRTTAAMERSAFAPPPTPGMIRSLLLAIAAHGVLLALLTAGVQWHRETPQVVAEAEIWSAVPEMAAPTPAPEPDPAPVVEPPPPSPVVEQAPPKAAPDIALEREKKRKEQLAQQEKLEKEKALKEKAEKEKQEKLKREKLELAKKEQAKQEQLAKEKKLQAERNKPDPKAAADAKRLEELRQQNLKRMLGQASSAVGNGDANATGSAAQASGPSAGYAGRIRARIKPNIIFTDTISSNPIAEVEVRTSPDGTIISRRLTKPSGVKSWDDAVLNAIDKTEVLPRDVDGRVPTSLVISFRPRD